MERLGHGQLTMHHRPAGSRKITCGVRDGCITAVWADVTCPECVSIDHGRAKTVRRIRLFNGQLQQWDDDPPGEFGQIWIAVCAWCHRGPINSGQVVCGECPAIPDQSGGYPESLGPRRDDSVTAWIKRRRDEFPHGEYSSVWQALDMMLDDYREHADTGTPLDRDVQGPHWEES